jgi:hypothetical protein
MPGDYQRRSGRRRSLTGHLRSAINAPRSRRSLPILRRDENGPRSLWISKKGLWRRTHASHRGHREAPAKRAITQAKATTGRALKELFGA